MKIPFILCILDGYGYSQSLYGNAIAQAQAPFLNRYLAQEMGCVLLNASGSAVGLPEGQMGNSQVGHLTIGAGRRIPGMLISINESIKNKSFFTLPYFKQFHSQYSYVHAIHIIGLVSDGGIHSSMFHLEALLKAFRLVTQVPICIHAILDGRDVPPRSAYQFLTTLDEWLVKYNARLGSIQGRYYAMDRDQHWDRTEQAFTALIKKSSICFNNWQAALEYYYARGITDEFIPPTQLDCMQCIVNSDVVVFFNFRPERMRQLVKLFLAHNQASQSAKYHLVSMIDFDDTISVLHLFKRIQVTGTLKEKLAAASKRIFTIAETEKYAHVTYFFDGYRFGLYPGEERSMIPSIVCRTHADNPCMAAPEITDTLIEALEKDKADFYLVNYANADMVGHSGDLKATIKAIECLDKELSRLAKIVQKKQGILMITADHGNAEKMIDEHTKQPHTAHTGNKVPLAVINFSAYALESLDTLTELADIAPWIMRNIDST